MYEVLMDGYALKRYRQSRFFIIIAKEIYKIAKKKKISNVRNSPSHPKKVCFLNFYFCISVFLKARQPTTSKLSQQKSEINSLKKMCDNQHVLFTLVT